MFIATVTNTIAKTGEKLTIGPEIKGSHSATTFLRLPHYVNFSVKCKYNLYALLKNKNSLSQN